MKTLREVRNIMILAALKRNNWCVIKAAKDLGIHPTTVYRWIETVYKQKERNDERSRWAGTRPPHHR